MTPLEKAALVGSELFDGEVDGIRAYAEFNADDARAIIRAFLEAAAEDSRTAYQTGYAANDVFGTNTQTGKAAILALKETING